MSFGETLRRLRMEKGLTTQNLAEKLYVDRSTVTRWENGNRLPDAELIARIAACLDTDVSVLFSAARAADEALNVILVDDEQIILTGSIPVIEEVMPEASIRGFTVPSAALEFAKSTPVSIAFLDIELGRGSGLTLCRKLLEVNPRTNVIFLTAYMEYSFDAWKTGASGFLMKPISAETVREQLRLLRYPVRGLRSL